MQSILSVFITAYFRFQLRSCKKRDFFSSSMTAQKIQNAKILPRVLKPILYLEEKYMKMKSRFEFDKARNIFFHPFHVSEKSSVRK